MPSTLNAVPLLILILTACSPATTPQDDAGTSIYNARDDSLTLWHVQSKATHNSYHLFGEVDFHAWNYSHLPLDKQAEQQGVRAFELDLNNQPGVADIRVFHVAEFDDQSSCPTLTACLAVLKSWSDANPGHLPLFIQMEAKTGLTPENMDDFFQRVEQQLTQVWTAEDMITPAMVQGTHSSLAAALLSRGWPTLRETRGKALFAWDDGGELRRSYTHGGTDLSGRLMFVNSTPTDSFAAVAILNEPGQQAAAIQAALAHGMLVRTRADTDGVEAQANDKTRLNVALASGAHFISTDYPGPIDGGFPYYVDIPDGTPSRCNPVTTADAGTCTSRLLEDLR